MTERGEGLVPSARRAVLDELVARGATIHALEPGGAIFVGGVDIDDERIHDALGAALHDLGPDIVWILLPSPIQLESLTAGMRTALIAQASGLLEDTSELMTVTDSPDQRIRIRCPRCNDHIPMSIIAVATDGPDGLSVRTMADPADVDLHNLSCTDTAARRPFGR